MAVRYFDDVSVGERIGQIDKGVITTAHIMRWSAAVENFHRIHYDQPFATGHEKLPGVLVNGSWKQHILVQMIKDALGSSGWLWKMRFRYRKMDVAGAAVLGTVDVIGKQEVAGFGFVTLKIELFDQSIRDTNPQMILIGDTERLFLQRRDQKTMVRRPCLFTEINPIESLQ